VQSEHLPDRTTSSLDDLRCELFDQPLADSDGPVGRTDVTTHPSTRLRASAEISYAAVEFELELMKKRLAVWEIFRKHIRAGATSWPEVQSALTPEDLSEIVQICDGRPLRDLLVRHR
jgi:hypothetical protein